MRRMLMVLGALTSLAACRDECDAKTFDAGCEGNVLVFCPEPGVDQVVPVRITRNDCGSKVCIPSALVCALSSSPEPLCADGGTQVCDGNARLQCSSGFATSRDPCKTCVGSTCEGGLSAACTGDGDCAPELQCADAGSRLRCVTR